MEVDIWKCHCADPYKRYQMKSGESYTTPIAFGIIIILFLRVIFKIVLISLKIPKRYELYNLYYNFKNCDEELRLSIPYDH